MNVTWVRDRLAVPRSMRRRLCRNANPVRASRVGTFRRHSPGHSRTHYYRSYTTPTRLHMAPIPHSPVIDATATLFDDLTQLPVSLVPFRPFFLVWPWVRPGTRSYTVYWSYWTGTTWTCMDRGRGAFSVTLQH
jgi:hypothetical protein